MGADIAPATKGRRPVATSLLDREAVGRIETLSDAEREVGMRADRARLSRFAEVAKAMDVSALSLWGRPRPARSPDVCSARMRLTEWQGQSISE